MYSIKFNTTDDYTEVIISGMRRSGMEKSDGADGWISVANYCNENKVEKLLLISKLAGRLPEISSYDISSSLHHFGLKIGLKIAFVDSVIETYNINNFVSRFPRNQGYNIKVFNNKNQALNWLISTA